MNQTNSLGLGCLVRRYFDTGSKTWSVISYRNEFVDDKGCIQQSSNMHGMYITMMKRLQVWI